MSHHLVFSFLGLSQSLPTTSYIKMIDIWMLFTMTIPFLEVIQHTTKEVLKGETVVGPSKVDVVRVKSAKDQGEEKEETKNTRTSIVLMRLAGQFMLPVISLIFIFTFWTVGLVASFSSGAIQDPTMTDCLTLDLN